MRNDKESNSSLKEQISIGLKEAYRKMLLFKKYKNSPIVLTRNGKIIEVKAEDLLLEKK